jgi:threonine synthase
VNYFFNLECGFCQNNLKPDRPWNLCPDCGKPLLARYDLSSATQGIQRNFIERAPSLWRYHELLPVYDSQFRLSLGEGFTPLIHARRLGQKYDTDSLFIKDESLNPTGSFKARGLCMAVSKAIELGIREVSIPSAGNAAGALCAYASVSGITAHVYMPRDVPRPFIAECQALGGQVTLIDGLITDCGAIAAEEARKYGRFDLSTLKEPYRIEGKKTMGYEIAEQMNWILPDVIIYPTGGGTGLVGMWKAFSEMEELGWIESKRPRMVSVQSQGCAPIVKAVQDKTDFAESWSDASTIADGLRVPAAVGDFLILKAIRESRGTAVAVSDEELLSGATTLGHTEGIFACPEGGATLAAFIRLRQSGWIAEHETVVLFNTGSGHKYYHLWNQSKN